MPMRRNDPVTQDVYEEVVERDTIFRWISLCRMFKINPDKDIQGVIEMWYEAKQKPCVAPALDPLGSGHCLGRLTLDHVHRHAGGTKGKRAPSNPQHLVSLCALHHLGEGDKGGRIWATSHRDLLRAYLDGIYGDDYGDDTGGSEEKSGH